MATKRQNHPNQIKTKHLPVQLHGRIALPAPQQLILATDAATSDELAGMGYIATSGQFGCIGHAQPKAIATSAAATPVAELRAIYYGLAHMPEDRNIIVLCDSRAALSYIDRWRHGVAGYPVGYTLERANNRTATLKKLMQLVRKDPDRYTFRWVKSHNQHPLNEAADSLAKLGLRTQKGWNTPAEARALASGWAERRLRESS